MRRGRGGPELKIVSRGAEWQVRRGSSICARCDSRAAAGRAVRLFLAEDEALRSLLRAAQDRALGGRAR